MSDNGRIIAFSTRAITAYIYARIYVYEQLLDNTWYLRGILVSQHAVAARNENGEFTSTGNGNEVEYAFKISMTGDGKYITTADNRVQIMANGGSLYV